MAELTLQERLQPSLLDRLTDEDPHNPKEAAERRVMSMNQLKASVLRDLAWLFNTCVLFDPEQAAQMPAGSSVLNFGLPPWPDTPPRVSMYRPSKPCSATPSPRSNRASSKAR